MLPSLKEFNDGAFTIEQGITNPGSMDEGTIGGTPIHAGVDPVPEPEIDQRAIDAADAFVRFLAPPAPLKLSSQARRGRGLFEKIACDRCHLPVLKTGDSPIEALRYKDFPPTPTCCSTTWAPSWPTSASGWPLPRSSGPSR